MFIFSFFLLFRSKSLTKLSKAVVYVSFTKTCHFPILSFNTIGEFYIRFNGQIKFEQAK